MLDRNPATCQAAPDIPQHLAEALILGSGFQPYSDHAFSEVAEQLDSGLASGSCSYAASGSDLDYDFDFDVAEEERIAGLAYLKNLLGKADQVENSPRVIAKCWVSFG